MRREEIKNGTVISFPKALCELFHLLTYYFLQADKHLHFRFTRPGPAIKAHGKASLLVLPGANEIL